MREWQVCFVLTLAIPMLHTYTPDVRRSEPNCPRASQADVGSDVLVRDSCGSIRPGSTSHLENATQVWRKRFGSSSVRKPSSFRRLLLYAGLAVIADAV